MHIYLYRMKPLQRGLSSASCRSGKSLKIYVFTVRETGKKKKKKKKRKKEKKSTVSSLSGEVIPDFLGLPKQESSYLGTLHCCCISSQRSLYLWDPNL